MLLPADWAFVFRGGLEVLESAIARHGGAPIPQAAHFVLTH
jgi:hypothetical protein